MRKKGKKDTHKPQTAATQQEELKDNGVGESAEVDDSGNTHMDDRVKWPPLSPTPAPKPSEKDNTAAGSDAAAPQPGEEPDGASPDGASQEAAKASADGPESGDANATAQDGQDVAGADEAKEDVSETKESDSAADGDAAMPAAPAAPAEDEATSAPADLTLSKKTKVLTTENQYHVLPPEVVRDMTDRSLHWLTIENLRFPGNGTTVWTTPKEIEMDLFELNKLLLHNGIRLSIAGEAAQHMRVNCTVGRGLTLFAWVRLDHTATTAIRLSGEGHTAIEVNTATEANLVRLGPGQQSVKMYAKFSKCGGGPAEKVAALAGAVCMNDVFAGHLLNSVRELFISTLTAVASRMLTDKEKNPAQHEREMNQIRRVEQQWRNGESMGVSTSLSSIPKHVDTKSELGSKAADLEQRLIASVVKEIKYVDVWMPSDLIAVPIISDALAEIQRDMLLSLPGVGCASGLIIGKWRRPAAPPPAAAADGRLVEVSMHQGWEEVLPGQDDEEDELGYVFRCPDLHFFDPRETSAAGEAAAYHFLQAVKLILNGGTEAAADPLMRRVLTQHLSQLSMGIRSSSIDDSAVRLVDFNVTNAQAYGLAIHAAAAAAVPPINVVVGFNRSEKMAFVQVRSVNEAPGAARHRLWHAYEAYKTSMIDKKTVVPAWNLRADEKKPTQQEPKSYSAPTLVGKRTMASMGTAPELRAVFSSLILAVQPNVEHTIDITVNKTLTTEQQMRKKLLASRILAATAVTAITAAANGDGSQSPADDGASVHSFDNDDAVGQGALVALDRAAAAQAGSTSMLPAEARAIMSAEIAQLRGEFEIQMMAASDMIKSVKDEMDRKTAAMELEHEKEMRTLQARYSDKVFDLKRQLHEARLEARGHAVKAKSPPADQQSPPRAPAGRGGGASSEARSQSSSPSGRVRGGAPAETTQGTWYTADEEHRNQRYAQSRFQRLGNGKASHPGPPAAGKQFQWNSPNADLMTLQTGRHARRQPRGPELNRKDAETSESGGRFDILQMDSAAAAATGAAPGSEDEDL